MADVLSRLRTGGTNLLDQVKTAAPISGADAYQLTDSDSQFTKGLRTGAAGMSAGAFAREALAAKLAGEADWQAKRDAGMRIQQEAEVAAPRVRSLRDINGVGDALDFAGGAIGQGAISMAPAIAGAVLLRGRGSSLFSRALPYAGAAAPSYALEKGETALGQYEDPTLAAASAEDRDRAATMKGLVNAVLESIVPGSIGASLLRKPAGSFLGHVGREMLTEGATEAAQQYTGHLADKSLDPNRQLDPWEMADAFAAGALTGGAVSGAGRAPSHALGAASDALSRQAEAAAARTPPPEPGIDPNAPVDLGGPDAPGGGFGEGFTAGMDAVRGVKDDLVAKAKDGLDEVLNRTSEARAAGLEGMDFAREVFRPTLAERAASDALPENEDPAVQSAPDIEAALRDRPTRLAANAASFADELLARTDLPKAVRAKIESMGGNYADPVNQKYLTTFALGSDFQDSLTEGIEGLKALGRRVSSREKHNLQDISEVDAQPLVALLAQRLGPDLASDAPKLARQLLASSVRLNPSAGVSEEADAKLRKFSSVVDDDVLDTISQLTGTDELRGVLGNIRNLPGAEADVRRSNGGSFLESMLLQPSLPAGSLPAVARYVDEAVKKLEGASPQYKANLIEPLSKVVADPEAVLDYYGKLRADRTKLEASKDKNYSSAMSTMSELFDDMPEATEDPTYEGAASAAEWGAINEEDQSNNAEYGFREVATKRPFRKFVAEELSGGKRRTEAMRAINDARGRIGDADYRTMPYGDYLQQVENVAPEEGVARIKADIQKRIKNHLSHKGEDRTQQVNELEGELQLLEYNTKKENAKYALDQYEVTTRSRRKSMDNVATDDDIKAMKTALKVKGDEKGRTEEDVAPTRVEFRMVDGKSLVLSAESMIKTLAIKRSKQQGKIDSPNKEGSKQLFADAVASVLAREDVADLVTDLNKVQLSREGNKPLVRKPRSEERRASQQALEDIMEGTPVGVPARRARIRRLASILDRLINKYGVEDELVQRTMDYIEGLHSMAQAEFVAAKHAASVVRAKLGEKSNVSMRSLKYRLADLKAEGIAIPKIFDKAKTDADIQLAASLFLQNLIAKQDVAQSANEDYRNAYYAARETIKEAKQELAGDKLEDEGGEIASFSAAKPAGEISRSDEARRTGHTELRDDGKGSHASDIEPTKRERLQAELDTIKRLANKPGTTEEQKAELRERWAEVSAALKAAGETTVAEGFDEAMRKAADPTVRGKAVPAKASYTDAVLAANPELLTVLNRFGEPKDKGWAEAEIRKRVYNAYAKLQTTPLKARLEALRKKYSEARAAGNEQEAKTVQHIGELIKHVLAARGVANNATGQKRYAPLGAKYSTVGDSTGQPGMDRKTRAAVAKEIHRLRGKNVKLRISRLIKDLGYSGASFDKEMPDGTVQRWIEIALDAKDPMSVAWHESLHDFFRILGEDRTGRSIKRDLTNAANAPHVKRQLEKLLAAHPKALEQIKNDPEERIAYMYQFWAAGELNIGPTGTSIFQKLRQFFFDMFKIATSDQRAEDILTAFHEGKFADERVVAEVLADLPRDTVRNRIERFSPALSDFLHATAQIAPDRLRDFQNEEISALADKLEQLVRRRFQQQGVWENKLADILAGTTAVERRAAVENMQARKDPSSPLEKKLAEFYKGMYDYMSKSGVETYSTKDKKWMPLRQVGDYFPRSWDPAAIQKDPQGFIALLAKHGNMSPAASKKLIDAIVAGDGRLELAEDEHSLGFTPFAKAAIDRQLTFINKANAADFAKYQQKDLMDITSTYIRQAVHRAEYAKLFENDGSGLAKHIEASGITDKKDLEAIDNSIRAMEGTLNQDKLSLGTKNLMSGAMTLQNITLLPLAIFSQSIDPIVMAARTGDLKDAGNAYVTALKRLRNFVGKSKDKVPGEELAEMLGIISQDSVLEAMGYAYGSTYMNRPLTKINRTFFKWNGMQGWNNSMRIAATVAGEKYLLANRNNAKALEELGLEPSDIQVLQAYNNGVRGEGLDYSNPKIREAMYQFVDQAVLRPSAANRPVWMSDPRFQLVAHLKQFTFAMHNVVLKRATQQADEGNHVPWAILGLTVPVILAADMAKFALTGTTPANWGFMDYLVHSVERSGILGLGDSSVQATRGMDSGAAPGEGLLGPTLENLFKILRWAGGDPRVKFEDVLDRTVPGAKFV